jgi:hypothetical protein
LCKEYMNLSWFINRALHIWTLEVEITTNALDACVCTLSQLCIAKDHCDE